MGPIIENVEKLSGLSPRLEPGLIRKYDKEYFKRMEAMEFAVKYDSCQRDLDLSLADLIILGVSRTSKTPLSMYLAHKGVKVANITKYHHRESHASRRKCSNMYHRTGGMTGIPLLFQQNLVIYQNSCWIRCG